MKHSYTFLLALFSIFSYSQSLELFVSGGNMTHEINTEVHLVLELSDASGNFKNANDINDIVIDLKSFKKEIVVIGKTEGLKEFGPYTIKIGNCSFQSNTVKIQFINPIEKLDQFADSIYFIAPNSVELNEIFEISIVSNFDFSKANIAGVISGTENQNVEKIKFDLKYDIEVVNSTYSSSQTISNGQTKSEHKYVFKLKALSKGEIVINNNSFTPEITTPIKEMKIKVK